MPLYWILSTMMILFLLMMVLKIYGNYFIMLVEENMMEKVITKNLWYW